MKRILIVIGAPATNMGSQAIVRGLVKNIKSVCKESHITLMATYPDLQNRHYIDGVDVYMPRYSIGQDNTWNYPRIANGICRRIYHNKNSEKYLEYYDKYRMYDYLKQAHKSDLIFIVGADNYDSSYPNCVAYMNETNRFIDEIGAEKMVMYNCSFSERDLSVEVVRDISRFRYITVRDSVSYENARKKLPNKDVKYFPDVAFCMDPIKIELPHGWKDGNMVGINLSSLICDTKRGSSEEQVLHAYGLMIDYILENTPLNICFIAHVKNDADLSVLRKLYENMSDESRAILIDHENYNAAQKKYIISQCRMFVGARTHATIAAYSSLVPTLVVGYSIKSVGIATDLLGTDKGNVIPVSELNDPNALKKAFQQFMERENSILDLLRSNVPGYIEKAQGVQGIIKEIMK